jgi:hypothetical protein
MYHSVMSETQSFKNHGRLDPPLHFVVVPILFVNFIVMIVAAVNHRHHNLPFHIWLVVVSIALLILALNTRVKDLKVQDRIIRLEEQLRYAAVLPPAALVASADLTIRQIVALRFAPDAELPALINRAISENLDSRQIKQSIVNWKADNHRV